MQIVAPTAVRKTDRAGRIVSRAGRHDAHRNVEAQGVLQSEVDGAVASARDDRVSGGHRVDGSGGLLR